MSVEAIVLSALAGRRVLWGRLLRAEEVERVRELEETYSRTLTPWGKPVNLGAMECLKRRYVLAALTLPDFKWPPGPYALIKVGGTVVGIIDENGLSLNRKAFAGAKGDHELVILPLRLPELEELVDEPVGASPSPPTHRYLAELLGCRNDCGSLLVAFNRVRAQQGHGDRRPGAMLIKSEARGESVSRV
jgi:hypothetical protein